MRPGSPVSSSRSVKRTALLVALLCASGCARPRAVYPRAPVILVSVDTLRADHLPAYGYRDVETPGLDALQKDAVVFENAWAAPFVGALRRGGAEVVATGRIPLADLHATLESADAG